MEGEARSIEDSYVSSVSAAQKDSCTDGLGRGAEGISSLELILIDDSETVGIDKDGGVGVKGEDTEGLGDSPETVSVGRLIETSGTEVDKALPDSMRLSSSLDDTDGLYVESGKGISLGSTSSPISLST